MLSATRAAARFSSFCLGAIGANYLRSVDCDRLWAAAEAASFRLALFFHFAERSKDAARQKTVQRQYRY